ncbi:hypothetical protein KUTeg_016453 [Tegillarca granosa]|uniref:protein-tyrosine-phosphatase n=1 Tax=Tegillarca granosa TaxID=220873 RepID=A0ABQ9ERK1_TEGGR|nr:hypothetical protein KUTeg_016453 [Tegillarca granosa]
MFFGISGISKMVKRALVTNSTTEDISIINTCIENTTMLKKKDFICTHTIFGRFLILEFENNADICEIGIHGGKNIALWKSTNQSSTINNYTSNKAVDGNIGDYQIVSDSCIHTSGDSSPIKPYWEVAFAKAFLIQRIVIFFRDELSYPNILKRSSNYSLLLINNGHVVELIQSDGKPHRKDEIVLQQPVLVTSVKIGLPNVPSEESVLSLCEVEVFACRLGPDGDVCSNSCPIYCNPRNNQSRCTDFTCPENSCAKPWHNAHCSQKECSKNDLKLIKLKINETPCSSSPCLSGEKINVECVEGYTLKGSGYVMCGKDGNWSFDTTCKANTCLLPNDVHTHTNVTGQSNVVKFGTALTITCDSGYHVKSSIDRCQLNGTWSSTGLITAPLCIANTCLLPNDVHTHTNVTGQSNVTEFGTAIMIACDSGYHVKSSIDRCQLNGTWSSTGLITAPLCIENTCSLPINDEHARINQTAGKEYVRVGTSVKIGCDIGYRLKIPEEVFCQLNGTWNFNWDKSLPVCEDLENGNQNSYVGIGVGIGSTAFIVIIAIVAIILFVKRKKKDKEETENAGYMEKNEASTGNVYSSIEETEIVTETELTNDDTARESSGYYSFLSNKAISKNAIKIENFINYVEENKGKNGSIVSQFSNLLTGLQYPAKVACFQQNKPKNDATRVVLNRPKEMSDYINASYINGYDSVKRYVASQGPMKGTEEDFWEMVYQLRSDKIVMLTNVFEEGKHKCVQYWPDKDILKFGTMSVQLKSVDRYADFTVRLLSIKQDGSEWRKIRQFHFTAWPDRGVPKYASSLVQFRHKVLSMSTKGKGPLIVHCSAGIGRTGTFIALDILVAQARSTGQVDVYTCVETLRCQRVNMVQTAEQYLFLHHALEEALMCKTTATAASDFPELYAKMQQRLQNERTREIDKEFQTLNETSPVLQEEEFASGKTSQNKKKNRYSNILPVESHRIYLCSYVPGRSDYINAVLLPSYKESKAFIATQMPLPDTVIDFLCLVYESDVSSVVMLNEMDDKKTVGRYWPENEDAFNVGPYTVTKSGEKNMDCMIIKQLKIQYESQKPRVVNQFQVKFWPDNEMVPSSVSDILTVMEHVQQWQRKTGGHNPVVVHCMNGCDKTGLYCVVEATIERLKIEQDVGIQQIIKQMRSRRPQIIPCIIF